MQKKTRRVNFSGSLKGQQVLTQERTLKEGTGETSGIVVPNRVESKQGKN